MLKLSIDFSTAFEMRTRHRPGQGLVCNALATSIAVRPSDRRLEIKLHAG